MGGRQGLADQTRDKRPKLERAHSAAEKENLPLLQRSGNCPLRRQYSQQEQVTFPSLARYSCRNALSYLRSQTLLRTYLADAPTVHKYVELYRDKFAIYFSYLWCFIYLYVSGKRGRSARFRVIAKREISPRPRQVLYRGTRSVNFGFVVADLGSSYVHERQWSGNVRFATLEKFTNASHGWFLPDATNSETPCSLSRRRSQFIPRRTRWSDETTSAELSEATVNLSSKEIDNFESIFAEKNTRLTSL